MAKNDNTEAKESKSLFNEKYRTKDYKGSQDWLSQFMTDNVYNVDDKGDPTDVNGSLVLDLLARNAMGEVAAQYKKANYNAGQLRMNAGNRLRAAAKRRGGLFDINGKWVEAPEGYAPKITETRAGEKIRPAKDEEKTKAA